MGPQSRSQQWHKMAKMVKMWSGKAVEGGRERGDGGERWGVKVQSNVNSFSAETISKSLAKLKLGEKSCSC